MRPPPHGGRCRPPPLAQAWPHTRVPPALPRTLPALGGLALPAAAPLPRGPASAGQRRPQRTCPTRGVPAQRPASLPLAQCSCRCRHLAGTRGTAVTGWPGGCCHAAGVRVGGRDAGSMRDRIGGAADADGPSTAAPGSAPQGRTRQERERPRGSPGFGRSGGRSVGSAAGGTGGARGWRPLAGVTADGKWRLQTKDQAGGGELREAGRELRGGPVGGTGLPLCARGSRPPDPPPASRDVP
ncbi:translation initiation factor IF-2-like [Motacilla alba alba]|uniref:translation initiation factor IF-2-like n=1 Tax=Motacilla alba alba TaxID=1094192 RepID=UPI0018D50C73|nr:translation initiation factor IF-2-like [Motacilla alba alba]